MMNICKSNKTILGGWKINRLLFPTSVMVFIVIFMILTVPAANGLKCIQCGQYNEGVGSITPCLNYSDKIAHNYLKECSKKSEKFCVKYVSELSTVRDCATECVEKEIWETQTYCCNADGCNGSKTLELPFVMIFCITNFALYKLLLVLRVAIKA